MASLNWLLEWSMPQSVVHVLPDNTEISMLRAKANHHVIACLNIQYWHPARPLVLLSSIVSALQIVSAVSRHTQTHGLSPQLCIHCSRGSSFTEAWLDSGLRRKVLVKDAMIDDLRLPLDEMDFVLLLRLRPLPVSTVYVSENSIASRLSVDCQCLC